MTPLIIASNTGYLALVKVLLDNKADLSITDNMRFNAIIHAVKNQHIDVVKELLVRGAKVNLRSYMILPDDPEVASFFWVCINKNAEIAKVLLEAGTNIHTPDEFDYTYLMRATHFECIEIVRLLLGTGADVNVVSNNSQSAFTIAMEKNNSTLIALFATHMVEDLE